ncbi:MAG TPA: Gfo/Idh/MocA family oxidoreductase [Vicinamibacteria bacterium]|nr:Gfo/Idh/MocA family oxidoreductase [Vicinamibacteria bacterium]
MKATSRKECRRQMTRREFVGGALGAAGVITGAPALLRGKNLNGKLDIAFIASGGRATDLMDELTLPPGRDRRGAAAGGEARGGAVAAAAPHPDENVALVCDVDQNAVDSAAVRFPKARKFNDLRRVFDEPKSFDAVVVATCEHTHAFATYLALTHGKHVYCEKPLAYNIWETRLIRETAAKHPRLATQMGNQGHAAEARRTIREILMTGVIGPVREVHVWASRAWGLQDAASAERFDKPHGFYNGIQIVDRFPEEMPVPPNIHWDLWLGPAPARPFHATYLPGPRWYRWWDFGNGTMSDLGSHDNDVPFTVLDLWRPDGEGGRVLAPLTVEALSPSGRVAHKELAPATMTVTYEFAAVGSQPALKLVWHQGDSKPPGWVPEWGGRSSLFVGDKGMLLGSGKLLPEDRFKDFQTPPATLPRSPGHWVEWVNACKGDGPMPGSNFQYSGWTTEANHLGNVAYRTGKKIEWDHRNMRAGNAPEAAPFIKRPEYRKGWEGILEA